jgi:ferredoxin
MTARARIVFNRSTCAGIGLCEMHSPDVFKIDDDGLMTVQTPVVDGSRRAEIEEAAMSCPTQSIRIVDDEPTSGDDRCD